jgi:hypothetical protein
VTVVKAAQLSGGFISGNNIGVGNFVLQSNSSK